MHAVSAVCCRLAYTQVLLQSAAMAAKVEQLAQAKGCTAAQLALAWVHAQNSDGFGVVPIPGEACSAWAVCCSGSSSQFAMLFSAAENQAFPADVTAWLSSSVLSAPWLPQTAQF